MVFYLSLKSPEGPDLQLVLAISKSSMKNCEQQWTELHRGGEFSKFGNFPTTDWTLDYIDAMRCGWTVPDPEWKLYVLDDGDELTMSYGPDRKFVEDTLVSELFALDENEVERKEITNYEVSLFA
jgi:hypothetical protein